LSAGAASLVDTETLAMGHSPFPVQELACVLRQALADQGDERQVKQSADQVEALRH
jgi:hypothetical protein